MNNNNNTPGVINNMSVMTQDQNQRFLEMVNYQLAMEEVKKQQKIKKKEGKLLIYEHEKLEERLDMTINI